MIANLVSLILLWLETIINTIGYPGIFLAIVLENIFPPIPSEVIMFGAGSLVAQGKFNFWLVTICATLGAVVAGLFFYALGLYGGRPVIEKFGRYVKITPADLDYTDTWFKKYGDLVIFFGRFIPIVRTLVSFPAGITKVNPLKFLVYTSIGSFLWLCFLTFFGVFFGAYKEAFLGIMEKFELITEVLLVLLGVIGIYIFYRKKKKNIQ